MLVEPEIGSNDEYKERNVVVEALDYSEHVEDQRSKEDRRLAKMMHEMIRERIFGIETAYN